MKKKLNILVVDDDVANAESLAELLALDEHSVTVAHDGQQAIEAFRSGSFDMGFFDVMMPVKNGVDSFIEIKSRHPDARIYFMTGFSAEDMMDKAKSSGAMGVFSKPVDLQRMLDVVERQG